MFGKGSCEESPGIEYRILGNEGDEVEGMKSPAFEDLGGEGDEDEGGEEDACQRRDQDPEIHAGWKEKSCGDCVRVYAAIGGAWSFD